MILTTISKERRKERKEKSEIEKKRKKENMTGRPKAWGRGYPGTEPGAKERSLPRRSSMRRASELAASIAPCPPAKEDDYNRPKRKERKGKRGGKERKRKRKRKTRKCGRWSSSTRRCSLDYSQCARWTLPS